MLPPPPSLPSSDVVAPQSALWQVAAAAQQAADVLEPMPLHRYAEVKAIVEASIGAFAENYSKRRLAEMEKGQGLLAKIGNDFYREFDLDYAAYSTVTRSFDSALGTALQDLVIELAALTYSALPGQENKLQSPLTARQQAAITAMLERGVTPDQMQRLADPDGRLTVEEAEQLARDNPKAKEEKSRCDLLLLVPTATGDVPLAIEIKSGGQLDDKKANAEKRGLLEYCARYYNLHGVVPQLALAVLYDVRDRSDGPWTCSTVQNFFSAKELLIGRRFWNFVLNASDGYDVFLSFYHPASRQLNGVVKRLVSTFVEKAEALLAEHEAQEQAFTLGVDPDCIADASDFFADLQVALTPTESVSGSEVDYSELEQEMAAYRQAIATA